MVSIKEISDTIYKAMISDSAKRELVIKLARARAIMSDVDFNEFFTNIKAQIERHEKELN